MSKLLLFNLYDRNTSYIFIKYAYILQIFIIVSICLLTHISISITTETYDLIIWLQLVFEPKFTSFKIIIWNFKYEINQYSNLFYNINTIKIVIIHVINYF